MFKKHNNKGKKYTGQPLKWIIIELVTTCLAVCTITTVPLKQLKNIFNILQQVQISFWKFEQHLRKYF